MKYQIKIILIIFLVHLSWSSKIISGIEDSPNNSPGFNKILNLTNHDNSIQCRTLCPQLGQICVKGKGNLITCETVCGDGLKVGREQCDDGNTVSGDGCSNCLIDQGWSCQGQPSKCTSNTCGNKVWDQGQTCEYTFMKNCSKKCQINNQLTQECILYASQLIQNNPPPYYNSAVDQTFICAQTLYGFGCVGCLYIAPGYECGYLSAENPQFYFCAIKCPSTSLIPYLDYSTLWGILQTLIISAIFKYFPDANSVTNEQFNVNHLIDLLKVNKIYDQLIFNGIDVNNFSLMDFVQTLFYYGSKTIFNNVDIQPNGLNRMKFYYPSDPLSIFVKIAQYANNDEYLTDPTISSAAVESLTKFLTCARIQFVPMDPSTMQ